VLQDAEGRPPAELASALGGLIITANAQPELAGIFFSISTGS
jgi:hypothetical protein